jgi:lipopolysaccharide/colanic/teichoic acid biosynthesis glycosyltransferase
VSDLTLFPSSIFAPARTVSPVSTVSPVIDDVRLSGWRSFAKDAADRVFAVVVLLLTAPVFGYLALLVRMSGRGPVFVRQTRVGRNGRLFTLLKFRTVQWSDASGLDPEDELAPLLQRTDDELLPVLPAAARVSRIGIMLRLSGLDELPQLVNVVTGKMSVVGPRPRLPEQAAELPYEALPLLLAKPGLLGLSQLAGVSSGPERDVLDVRYVRGWSFGLDVAIFVRSVRSLVSGPRELRDPF